MSEPFLFSQPDFDIDEVAGFEGPEKRLEIDFKHVAEQPRGMRLFGREEWQQVLNEAKCTIISVTSNAHFDSYVLSESSLFVYPFKVVLKTCGTTTLLRAIPPMFELSARAGTRPDFLLFTRKNYNFPAKQHHPHVNFEVETEYLDQFFDGQAFVLGPHRGDHWHLYAAEIPPAGVKSPPSPPPVQEKLALPAGPIASSSSGKLRHGARPPRPDQTLEIMMSDLDRGVMAKFYRGELDAKETTRAVGIDRLIPGSISDEVLFTPCGYSVNGLRDDVYYTIHVTPEPQCSFVSYETNLALPSYTAFIRSVVAIFKPGRFCFSLYSDMPGQAGEQPRLKFDTKIPGYDLVSQCSQEFPGSGLASFCSYRLPPSDNVSDDGM